MKGVEDFGWGLENGIIFMDVICVSSLAEFFRKNEKNCVVLKVGERLRMLLIYLRSFPSWNICDVLRDLVPFLYHLKNVKNIHGRVLLLVKLQVSACNFTKRNAPPWVFSTFFEQCKWYHIAQSVSHKLL